MHRRAHGNTRLAVAEHPIGLLDRLFAKAYPTIIGTSEKKWLRAQRAELLAPLTGEVLEIGAGTGLNLSHYPSTVTELTVTEASPHMLEQLHRAVAEQRPGTKVLLATAEAIPAETDSVDHVVSTLVLCSVTDLQQVFSEVRRVLRPGGTFVVLEHVAGTGKVKRSQRRAEPFTKFFGRGCHVTRDLRGALETAGFDTSEVADLWVDDEPKIYAPHIVGPTTPRGTR